MILKHHNYLPFSNESCDNQRQLYTVHILADFAKVFVKIATDKLVGFYKNRFNEKII